MTQLILLPGLASDAVMWRRQLEAIPPVWKPHVTTVHNRHDTIAAMAHALLTEHAGDLVLCGASMGGIVAMEVARQAPHRLRGLALLGTNARPETPDMRRLREAALVFFEEGRSAELLRANVPLAFHPDTAKDPELARSYLEFVLAAGPEQLIRQNRARCERYQPRRQFPGSIVTSHQAFKTHSGSDLLCFAMTDGSHDFIAIRPHRFRRFCQRSLCCRLRRVRCQRRAD